MRMLVVLVMNVLRAQKKAQKKCKSEMWRVINFFASTSVV